MDPMREQALFAQVILPVLFTIMILEKSNLPAPVYYMYVNETKWPRQVRELILDSDSGIFDFWPFDEKNNG